jgi:rubrerythrin
VDEKLTLEEAWRLAIEKEKESHDLYLRLAAMTDDAATANLFQYLAKEETRHENMLRDEFERAFTPDM